MSKLPDTTPNKELTHLRITAMNLLARREHSCQELQQKLLFKHPSSNLIHEVLKQLQQQGLQSDSRFAEAFYRNRCRKGQGAYRIRRELQQRGIAEQLIDDLFAEQQTDWFALARELIVRRFGEAIVSDYKERSKRARFLQYRGFDNEQISYALDDSERRCD